MPCANMLTEAVFYDPASGLIRWRKSYGRNRVGGRPVGSKRKDGYLEARIGDRRFLLHRLAWLLMTGQEPEEQIDHINGDRADNRWGNLRLATAAENKRNRPVRKDSRSGYKGVTFHLQTGKWRARLRFQGTVFHLGLFETKEEAALAYNTAAEIHHGDFAKLNSVTASSPPSEDYHAR